MKKHTTLLCIPLFLFALSGLSKAENHVTEYRDTNKNLAEIQEISVEPIIFGEGLQLNDFDKARIQSTIKKGLVDLPIPQSWVSKKSPSESSKNKVRSRLIIEINKYGNEIYHNSGSPDTTIQSKKAGTGSSQDYLKDRYKKSIDPDLYIAAKEGATDPKLSSKAEIYNQSRIAIRFSLQDPKGQTSYWTYDQEQTDTLTRKNTDLDKTLKDLTEEAVKSFKKYYRDDSKNWKKKNKH